MRVIYVTSGLITCIREEIVAHRRAGWRVLPLVGSAPPARDYKLADIPSDDEPVRYRPGLPAQLAGILRETLRHPLRMSRIAAWLAGLLIADPLEFLKAVYELGPACVFAPQGRAFRGRHVHVHFASRSLSLGWMLSVLLQLPVSCTVHAFDMFQRSAGSLRYRLSRCRSVVAISDFNARYLADKCGAAVAGRTTVVHCGIPVEKFESLDRSPDGLRILSIGDLIPMKGHADLVRACATLRDRGAEPRLDIVGRGPEQAALERLIEEHGIADRVHLRRGVSNEELSELFVSASVFALACAVEADGNRDGIPMVLMEAMACGIPVVSTRVSGIPELIRDGHDGLLVDEGDHRGLAAALESVFRDGDLRDRLVREGRLKIRREFNISSTSETLRGLFAAATR